MNTNNMTVLVTGANRGIGQAFVEYFAAAGAKRVYAGARDISSLDPLVAQYPATLVPVTLDVTDRSSIADAAARANDVNVLINNAGTISLGGITSRDTLDDARREMDVNYFGLLEMSRAFAPALVRNAPSAMVNVLSILSIIGSPSVATYSASKAAALSATRVIRAELSPKGVRVIGVMPGYVDTDMARRITQAKISPGDVVHAAVEAIDDGVEDVYPGEMAQSVVASFFNDHKSLEKYLAESAP